MHADTDPPVDRRLELDGYAVVTVDERGWTTIDHMADGADPHSRLYLSPRPGCAVGHIPRRPVGDSRSLTAIEGGDR